MSETGCSLICRRILLLLWKNYLFRKRQYIVTAFEIILPTLFIMILVYMKTIVPPGVNSSTTHVTYFNTFTEMNMKESVSCGTYKKCVLAYAPNTIQTTRIMMDVKRTLPQSASFELKGFDNSEQIDLAIAEYALIQDAFATNIQAAVVFQNALELGRNFSVEHKISYKIRMENFMDTNHMFPSFQVPGPRNVDTYVSSGFAGLQITLDKILIKFLTTKEPKQEINSQAFPYPPYSSDYFGRIYFLLMPQFLVLGFIFAVPAIIRNVVSEKQTGIKELMKMMGLSNWMHWLGWMLNSMMVFMLSFTLVIILLFISFNTESGALLVHSDFTLWWFVFCLYAMAATTFCFFISTFFRRPPLATTVGIVLWIVSYYAIYVPLDNNYINVNILEKMAAALVPNVALFLAVKAMNSHEGSAIGAQWQNIATPINSSDNLSVGLMCLMLILDTIMYMCLTIYFENIIPSEFGLRKPWYYVFKRTWLRQGKAHVRDDIRVNSNLNKSIGFESQDPNLKPGIVIQNLSKTFGKSKVAVDRVSLNMYDGEITALLGHNGAGKTTLMSMLTGMFAPSAGSAMVNGYDIRTQMNQVRGSLGLCPQHNMLFSNLTVKQHLLFFGCLKGLTRSQACNEMGTLLGKLQLHEKRNSLSKSLSGGQKRKLNLGMALIGGTKVVILDEPSSGMDPEARRAIWNILLEMRGQRTILLTTHFMEEADVLGDRIAIMSAGRIKCYGTPMYLKRCYGAGYTLNLTIKPGSDTKWILNTIQKHIPDASLKPQQFVNNSEVAITLSSEGHSKFAQMFLDLEENKTVLGIVTIGLSLTTVDEVFVKVSGLQDNDEIGERFGNNVSSGPNIQNENGRSLIDTKPSHLETVRGSSLLFEQIGALFIKRFIYTTRKRRLMISQFLIPILLVIAAILLCNKISESYSFPALKMSLSHYKNPKTFYKSTDEQLGYTYATIVGPSAISKKNNISSELLYAAKNDLGAYRADYIVAAELDNYVINAMYSSIPYHAHPLSINLASNTILKALAPEKKYSIEVTNHPLKGSIDRPSNENDQSDSLLASIIVGIFVPIGLALFAATCIVFPMEEKLCKAKQLQLMTGISPFVFWGTSFIWDFSVMFVMIALMVLCFPIFQNYDVFTANGGAAYYIVRIVFVIEYFAWVVLRRFFPVNTKGRVIYESERLAVIGSAGGIRWSIKVHTIGAIFLILIVYGFSAISFSFLISMFAKSIAGGFSIVTIVHIITGTLLSLIAHLAQLTNNAIANHIRHFGRLFPSFGASLCVMRFTLIATQNSECNILPEHEKNIICNPSYFGNVKKWRKCCPNCHQLGIECFKPEPYITWNYSNKVQYDEGMKQLVVPGIGKDLLFLFLIGILYKCLLLLLEFGILQRVLSFIFESKTSTFISPSDDKDVQAETHRVQTLVDTACVDNDALVVHSLCKSYGSFAAVSNLSFGVHHGECFGLLGVNGAGKTTTFRLLTGDEIRSNGNVYGLNYTLEKNRRRFLGNIGYCPQFDGIVGVLSGREMLQLFSRLRGVQKRFVASEVDKWLNKMGLQDSGNVQCQKYSGGMKRRLSAAMALIGDPPIVLMDEPTTGVDPVARRQFWNVIAEVRDSGQAVILTSHSMEECEALCSRLGIMVNGQFQCIGGVQHLKNKFAQGFGLVLKLKRSISSDSSEISVLAEVITSKFHTCSLKYHQQNILSYQILNKSLAWDVLFQTMEDLKMQYKDLIEDYEVNETTLEEVFLSFARKQYPNRKANVSCVKKLITSQCCQ